MWLEGEHVSVVVCVVAVIALEALDNAGERVQTRLAQITLVLKHFIVLGVDLEVRRLLQRSQNRLQILKEKYTFRKREKIHFFFLKFHKKFEQAIISIYFSQLTF